MASILVVDDEYLVRNVLKNVLELNKHTVTEASDGMEALDSIDPNALPDLIFMDIRMPRLNGIDCAKTLMSRFPSLKIILLSGSFSLENDRYLAIHKHLFTEMLSKPFSFKDITRAVESALRIKAQERNSLFEHSNRV